MAKIFKNYENPQAYERELAAKLNIGEGFLSKVENDQKLFKRDDLKVLSNIYNVDLSKLDTLWLANKLYDLIKNESNGLRCFKGCRGTSCL